MSQANPDSCVKNTLHREITLSDEAHNIDIATDDDALAKETNNNKFISKRPNPSMTPL